MNKNTGNHKGEKIKIKMKSYSSSYTFSFRPLPLNEEGFTVGGDDVSLFRETNDITDSIN